MDEDAIIDVLKTSSALEEHLYSEWGIGGDDIATLANTTGLIAFGGSVYRAQDARDNESASCAVSEMVNEHHKSDNAIWMTNRTYPVRLPFQEIPER